MRVVVANNLQAQPLSTPLELEHLAWADQVTLCPLIFAGVGQRHDLADPDVSIPFGTAQQSTARLLWERARRVFPNRA